MTLSLLISFCLAGFATLMLLSCAIGAPASEPHRSFTRRPKDASGAPGLSLLWWNIEHGLTNQDLEGNPLVTNLRLATRGSAAPDVLILGEFKEGVLDGETRAELRGRYQEFFAPYSEESRGLGIAVFVERSIQVETFAPESLDWTPPGLTDAAARAAFAARWRRDYPDGIYFTRPYCRWKLSRQGVSLNLIPVHLIQPWEKMQLESPWLGSLRIASALLLGQRHPLYYQVERWRACLTRDFGPALDREPLIVVGDLNFPRYTPVYRRFANGLSEVFRRPVATFPTLNAAVTNRYPRMQIDHAFVAGGLEPLTQMVLPWQGSDHYPIAFKLGGPLFAPAPVAERPAPSAMRLSPRRET